MQDTPLITEYSHTYDQHKSTQHISPNMVLNVTLHNQTAAERLNKRDFAATL